MGWWRSRVWRRLAEAAGWLGACRPGGRTAPPLVLVVLGLWLAAAEAAAAPAPASGPRVAILFLPWSEAAGGDRVLLARLGTRRQLSLGLVSATAGGYSRAQALLDMSQGARVRVGLYSRPPPRLRLEAVRGGGGRIARWPAAVARAREAPATLVPGLQADAVQGGGGQLAYVGVRGVANLEAVVAADRAGRVQSAFLLEAARLQRELAPLWRRASLLVARLPDGAGGLAALDDLLAERRPPDLVVVVRAPPPGEGRLPLLAAGIAGPGFGPGETLSSATTRRPGLVAGIDLAPTALSALGEPVPATMHGLPVHGAPAGMGAGALAADAERLSTIVARRIAAVVALLSAWSAALLVGWLGGGRAGARGGLRLGLLMALWLPVIALAAAMLGAASPVTEGVLVAVASLVLAVLSDRTLGWPGAPVAPAAAALVAYAADFAVGSQLSAAAVTGSNPAGGARFFGAGNELEVLLGVSTPLGVGAALASLGAGARASAATFLSAGLAVGIVLGVEPLGADVGAAATAGAGAAAAAWWSLATARSGIRLLAAVMAACLLGALVLLAVEYATGGSSHLGRSVLDAPDARALAEVVERRLATQLAFLSSPGSLVIVAACLAALLAGVVGRRRLFAPLLDAGAAPLAAATVGALAAVLAGAIGNDSAPDMLAIGTAVLALAVLYARGQPPADRPPAEHARRRAAAPAPASTMPPCE